MTDKYTILCISIFVIFFALCSFFGQNRFHFKYLSRAFDYVYGQRPRLEEAINVAEVQNLLSTDEASDDSTPLHSQIKENIKISMSENFEKALN